jgi:hypothetical protein
MLGSVAELQRFDEKVVLGVCESRYDGGVVVENSTKTGKRRTRFRPLVGCPSVVGVV